MKTLHPPLLFPLLLGALALPVLAPASPVIWSANDHAYELVTNASTQGSYSAAKTAAEAKSFRGVPGRLLVLEGNLAAYNAELEFVRTNVVRPGSPATSYWVGTTRPDATGDIRTGWTWDDGSAVPTAVTNTWNIDLNEGGGATPYAAGFYSQDNYATLWDYARSAPLNFSGGYVVEYASPVPEPASLAALGFGALALLKRRRKG